MRSLVFIAALMVATPAVALDWIKVKQTGCLIWYDELRQGETMTWTGRCIDGKAEGYGALIREYKDESALITSIHWGEMIAGKSQGYGHWSTSVRSFQ